MAEFCCCFLLYFKLYKIYLKITRSLEFQVNFQRSWVAQQRIWSQAFNRLLPQHRQMRLAHLLLHLCQVCPKGMLFAAPTNSMQQVFPMEAGSACQADSGLCLCLFQLPSGEMEGRLQVGIMRVAKLRIGEHRASAASWSAMFGPGDSYIQISSPGSLRGQDL